METDGLGVLKLLMIKDVSIAAPLLIEKKLRPARTNCCMSHQILVKMMEFEASKKSASPILNTQDFTRNTFRI